MKKRSALLSVILTLALCLSAIGACAAGADTIVIGRLNDPLYLDPNAPDVGGAEVIPTSQVYEGLVTINEDCTDIIPCLATDWSVSEDGTVYTFNLLPGVKFSDGTPVTGADWEWSFYRARDTETSAYAFVAEAIDKVEATDAQVVITLKQPWAPFLAQLCNFNMVVGSKAYYEKVGEEFYNMNPLGTGPYMLKEWVRGDRLDFVANPYYHEEGYPKTANLQIKIVSDDNTRLMQLQSGQIDIADDIAMSLLPVVENDPNLNLTMFASTQIRYLILNTTKAPFDDVKVRQALYYALNKQEMSDVIAGEFGAPVAALVSETQGKWWNSDIPVIGYQPEVAKQMLADAGYPNGVDFTVSIRSGSAVYEQAAILMQAQVAEAGFNMQIELLESAALSDKYKSLNHQATILQWVDDYIDPSGVTGWTVDYDQCQAWYTGLNDVELDELNTAANAEMDEAKRVSMYWEIQQRINDNANVIPLFRNGFAFAAAKNIENLYVSPFNVYFCKYLTKG